MFGRPTADCLRVSSVPRPLIAILAATVLVFVLWTVALKHTLTGSGGGAGGSSSPGAYQSAIRQARGLQSVVNSAGARAGGTPVQSLGNPRDTTPTIASRTASPGPSSSAQKAHHAGGSHSAAGGTAAIASAARTSHSGAATAPTLHAGRPTGITLVAQALREHKVLALLFYNPAAPDDRAVHSEMSSIPTQGGRVVKLAVPVQQLGRYASLLYEVPVNFSPTLVLINRDRQAEEIAGFADSVEIAQRVAAALRSAPPKQ
jgi:hypothetical protein